MVCSFVIRKEEETRTETTRRFFVPRHVLSETGRIGCDGGIGHESADPEKSEFLDPRYQERIITRPGCSPVPDSDGNLGNVPRPPSHPPHYRLSFPWGGRLQQRTERGSYDTTPRDSDEESTRRDRRLPRRRHHSTPSLTHHPPPTRRSCETTQRFVPVEGQGRGLDLRVLESWFP